MVIMLDDHVGLIMKELKELGIDDNTIVFFTSDNGHELYYGPKSSYGRQKLPNGEKANLLDKKWRTSTCGDVFNGAGGRAGMKRSPYQGGIQCPMIVRWPNKIKPNTDTGLLSTHYDFMATMADLISSPLPKGKDGISYMPTLLGEEQTKKHEYVVIENQFNRMGVNGLVSGDGWKLVEIKKGKAKSYQLYNLNNDNEEQDDLAAQHPERVEELKEILLQQIGSE